MKETAKSWNSKSRPADFNQEAIDMGNMQFLRPAVQTLRQDIFIQLYFVHVLLINFASSFEIYYADICK